MARGWRNLVEFVALALIGSGLLGYTLARFGPTISNIASRDPQQ
jgi:hypothetical protein